MVIIVPFLVALFLHPVVSGLDRPVQVVAAHDSAGTLYIAQQAGQILSYRDGELRTFLDLTPLVDCCDNGGLLSIAFHPLYVLNGYLYVMYVDRNGDTVVARYTRDDPSSAKILLTVDQPIEDVPNHHGGTLQFGPDAYLWISIGDGGGLTNRAQQLDNFFGKLLRIDVDRGDPYAIPSDNPFGEIWSYGLRNPWRFSFDRKTGELLLADVGHDRREEVNMLSIAAARGANFGWPIMEGSECFQPNCRRAGLTLPTVEYVRDGGGCSVTGGYRYRGTRWTALEGMYLYGDFCSGAIFGAKPNSVGTSNGILHRTGHAIVSFGEDDDGEIYLVDYNGAIYQVTAPQRRRTVGR